ncbi:hypothetical protein M569_11495, partial [Genlisea aurea]
NAKSIPGSSKRFCPKSKLDSRSKISFNPSPRYEEQNRSFSKLISDEELLVSLLPK